MPHTCPVCSLINEICTPEKITARKVSCLLGACQDPDSSINVSNTINITLLLSTEQILQRT
jgi:hypothetical protein